MKTISQIVAAAAVGTVLMTSQAFAATGSLYPLDAWEHDFEGHMSSKESVESTDSLKSGYGDSLFDAWGNEIRTTE